MDYLRLNSVPFVNELFHWLKTPPLAVFGKIDPKSSINFLLKINWSFADIKNRKVTFGTSEFAVFSTISEFGELTWIKNLKEFFSWSWVNFAFVHLGQSHSAPNKELNVLRSWLTLYVKLSEQELYPSLRSGHGVPVTITECLSLLVIATLV